MTPERIKIVKPVRIVIKDIEYPCATIAGEIRDLVKELINFGLPEKNIHILDGNF